MNGLFGSMMIIAFAMMLSMDGVYSYSKRGIIKASASDFGLDQEDLDQMKRGISSKRIVCKLPDNNNIN
jgi:hypothetical protein